MRGIIRQFRKLPILSEEEKNLLSTQLKNINSPSIKKKYIIQRFRDKYNNLERICETNSALYLATSPLFPPALFLMFEEDEEKYKFMNAKNFCDKELVFIEKLEM
jgi:hypothetical protein